MAKKNIITVKDANIRTMNVNGVDYICITDIARQKNDIDPNGVIGNWMRNRNTIEFLGLWETLYNPNSNPLESRGLEIRQKVAEINNYCESENRYLSLRSHSKKNFGREIDETYILLFHISHTDILANTGAEDIRGRREG